MTGAGPSAAVADALLAARLLAVDPVGLGGLHLRAWPGPVRDHWLASLRAALPAGEPVRRLPLGVDDDRLLGGLDLAATLKAGRTILRSGVLAEADRGVVVVASAERLEGGAAARLAAALDEGVIRVEREGMTAVLPARIAVVALDEGEADERPPPALLDRLAFSADLSGASIRDIGLVCHHPDETAAARARLPLVAMADEAVAGLCEAASRLGIASLRAPILALRAARAHAALFDRAGVDETDLAAAARLVLAPRATRFPTDSAPQPQEEPAEPAPPDGEDRPPDSAEEPADQEDTPLAAGEVADLVLEAVQAALPAALLAGLQGAAGAGKATRARGETGMVRRSGALGRQAGSRRGDPRAGARLDLVATLRAAAPWQPLRRTEGAASGRVAIRRDDFCIAIRKPRIRAVAIFAVDASGSSAFNRLAEAKGAVELLLAEAYVRRDRVALIAFRGRGAELLLEPTRSLVRAKRGLAGLPGGGATPLAAGIDAATQLALSLRRRGDAPTLVLLTDGGANIRRGGAPGRADAAADALAAARATGAQRVAALVIDISPRGQPLAREVAQAMAARYIALPRADSAAMSRVVKAAME